MSNLTIEEQIEVLKDFDVQMEESNNNDILLHVYIRKECLDPIIKAVIMTDRLYNTWDT